MIGKEHIHIYNINNIMIMEQNKSRNDKYKTLLIKKEIKDKLDVVTKDIGKSSYSQILDFLTDFYHQNKK